jgi:hypothetical protein
LLFVVAGLLTVLAVGSTASAIAEPQVRYSEFDVAAQEESLLPLPHAAQWSQALLTELGAEPLGQLRLLIDVPEPDEAGLYPSERFSGMDMAIIGPGGALRPTVDPGMCDLDIGTADGQQVIYGVITGGTRLMDYDVLMTVGVVAIPGGQGAFNVMIGPYLGMSFGALQPTEELRALVVPAEYR